MSTILGRPITLGGGGKLPDIFGDGSDGDLVIKAGETVTLEVPVPHKSVIEKNYTSITIEAGGTLTTADYNAGLVLRCQGDCVIHGTIDQSGKAPKTNPDSTYQYPEELVCGKGGDGGAGGYDWTPAPGGVGMPARKYGGGYGGGGGGGSGSESSHPGGNGGNSDGITVNTPDNEMFLGGTNNGAPGTNGGGGAGGYGINGGYPGGAGGNGPGQNGGSGNLGASGGGGGAGNYGGGVVLLYVGENLYFDGRIDCHGENGGSGSGTQRGHGGGGGGGGGGSIYICHNGTVHNTGALNVNGGIGGGTGGAGEYESYPAIVGESGSIGTTTIKQYEKGMTA
jgi:hypothetical protein